MTLMFAFMGAYFYYDYKVGYPKSNVVHGHFRAFVEAEKLWKEEENRGKWAEVTEGKTISYEVKQGDEMKKTPVPSGTNMEEPWPDILHDPEEVGKHDEIIDLWKEYTADKDGWAADLKEDDYKTESTVNTQLYLAIVCGVLTLIALYFFIRTKGRSMRVDEEAYYAPGGKKVLFSEMKRIDKRKWDTKGLATIYFDQNGSEEKVKVDGMVYGQFKEEDGAPAEALFQKIMKNFSGELIDLAVEDDEDEEVEEGSGEADDVADESGEGDDGGEGEGEKKDD